MGEFKYEPNWIYSARVISNASFDEITDKPQQIVLRSAAGGNVP